MIADKVKSEKAANKLLSSRGIDSPCVPVKELARSVGCIVKFTPLDDDLSGMAFVKNKQRIIVVNSNHHPNRQRFTMAHELAHHQLHIELIEQGVHVDKIIFRRGADAAQGVDCYEIEANAFAAELLMPKKTIRALVTPNFDLHDEEQLFEISKKLCVSTSALYYRINNIFS